MPEIIPNWHPFWVHFTLALGLTGGALLLAGALVGDYARRERWLWAARLNLLLAAGAALLTVYFGWRAYNTVTHDTPSHLAMTDHRNWALVTAGLLVALGAYAHVRRRHPDLGWPLVVLTLVTLVMLGVTGWKGAELVYRHGLGVMSLPQAEGHAHGDDHDHREAPHSHEASPPPAEPDLSLDGFSLSEEGTP